MIDFNGMERPIIARIGCHARNLLDQHHAGIIALPKNGVVPV